jgi:hypothetical protein
MCRVWSAFRLARAGQLPLATGIYVNWVVFQAIRIIDSQQTGVRMDVLRFRPPRTDTFHDIRRSAPPMQKKPISFDSTGRRATQVPRLALFSGVVSISLIVACVVSLFIGLHAGERHIGLAGMPRHPLADVREAATDLLKPAKRQVCDVRAEQRQWHAASQRLPSATAHAPPMSLGKPGNRALAIGFYVNWDASSYPSLKRALPTLDWVIPTWMSVSGPDMALHAAIDVNVLQLIRTRKPATPILPLLQNAVDGNWDGQGLARLLTDPAARQARIADIVTFLAANDFQGVTIDF